MFVNLHVLFTLAGANPNRDDTGAPKTLFYGGVERARISSQAMTRAKRIGYETSSNGEKTYRSANLAKDITQRVSMILENAGVVLDEKETKNFKNAVVKEVTLLTSNKEKTSSANEDAGEEKNSSNEGPKDTLVWLAEKEIERAAMKIASKYLPEREEDETDFINGKRTSSLAIAAFGRMFANRPDLQNEAAIQRADAFTTHRAEIELDFFTAVDDLATTQGAGHLGIKMETGGVYYWHANIDKNQLLETWEIADRGEAKARLKELFLSLFLSLPTGGQNTHAHQVLPSLVLVTSSTRPISLQSAFETPVKPDRETGGHLERSVQALSLENSASINYASHLFLDKPKYAAMKPNHVVENSERIESLEALASYCADLIMEG